MNRKAEFEALRARCAAKRAAVDEHDLAMVRKYGLRHEQSWLSSAERSKAARLRAADEKAWQALYAHIQTIGGRDWSYGVPCTWLRDEATYEDIVRPASEPLGVVPPLAYGYSEHRT